MNKLERVLDKIDIPQGCWPWKGAKNATGYGVLRTGPRGANRLELAHRLMWEAVHGPIIGTQHVLHHCDNPPCVNPTHLYLGTQRDNMRDRDLRGRNGMAKLTPETVRLMRTAHSQGWSFTRLAQQFGVAVPTAYEAVTRRSWQRVE